MLTHFSAMLIFALFTSIVFGITQRADPKLMIRFGGFCFAMFVGGTIVASWVMYLIKH
jgi:flagellar biosynthesis protein FliR